MEVKNRFVHSATCEAMAEETGEVTDSLIKRYEQLARGGIGLIIPGFMFVHPRGRAKRLQIGIHNDEMIPGLKKLVEAVHKEDCMVAFQIMHAGGQTNKAAIGRAPIAPSRIERDPSLLSKSKEMSEEDIAEVIEAFGEAARRAAEAGADGVQLHVAHGYLLNQFLSPFHNRREDGWGGSDEKRFRFLREVFFGVRKALHSGVPVLAKLNANDYAPRQGITPPLAKQYVQWLVDLGLDGLEVSCGGSYSIFGSIRGGVPVSELATLHPWWLRPVTRSRLRQLADEYGFYEGFNLESAEVIKPALGSIPMLAVGGIYRVSHMEEILERGHAEFISMCRPFVREPSLVNKIAEGKTEAATCKYCNRCFAAIMLNRPLRCYYNKPLS